jgi:tetratricopeptide (TPR) repeat protein
VRQWGASFTLSGLILITSCTRYETPLGESSKHKLSPAKAKSTIESVTSHLNSNPEDFNAWAQLAIAHYYAGPDHYADGLNALDKARSLGATSETLFYYAGVMYEGIGLPDYAIPELSKYLRHYPNDFETKVRLANLLFKQGKKDEAYAEYQALVKKWPNDPTLWFNLGLVCKEKEDWDGALAAFAKVKSLAKQLPEGGIYQEGEIARLRGFFDQALPLYQQELSLHPEYMPALIALENVQKRLSLWKDARETRTKIANLKQKQTQ